MANAVLPVPPLSPIVGNRFKVATGAVAGLDVLWTTFFYCSCPPDCVFVAQLGEFGRAEVGRNNVRQASPTPRDQFRIVECFDKLLP